MLFHITHVHSAESCPAHEPSRVRETFGAMFEGAAEAGVSVKSATLDAAGHAFFLVVEADSSQALQDFLFPVLPVGVADTRPVTDALETVRQRGEEA